MKLIILAILLMGCEIRPEHNWQLTHPPSETVEWTVLSKPELHHICGISVKDMPLLIGCAIQIRETKKCWIYSSLTNEQARNYQYAPGGHDIEKHELYHCAGWRHPAWTSAI